MDFGGIAAIITALGTIVLGYLAYNQETYNKRNDLKLEELRKKGEEQQKRDNANIAQIYGELWDLLLSLNCDRVYIVQPHPLVHSLYLSITLEVCQRGVSRIKETMQELPMAEVPLLSSEMAKNDLIIYNSMSDIEDNLARAMMSTNGTRSLIIKRLKDTRHDWIGSIFCAFDYEEPRMDLDSLDKLMRGKSDNIQYILPEL